MKTTRVTALLAALGAACAAQAQIRTNCAEGGPTSYMDMTFHHEYSTNASCCSGGALANAIVIDMLTSTELRESHCDCPDNLGPILYSDPQPGTKSNSCVILHSEASSANSFGGSSRVDLDWCCTGGSSDIEAHSVIVAGTVSDGLGVPDPFCYFNKMSLASGIAGGQKVFCYPGSVAWTSGIDISASFDLTAWSSASKEPLIIFVSEDLERGGNHGTRQGVYRIDSSGNSLRLGFFADSAWDPTVSGSTVSFGATGYGLASSVPSGTGDVTMTFSARIIPALDGKLDSDDRVCYTDRAILHGLLGVSIGDPTYDPRCDLNLDGDIDAADMAIFNTLPCNANWDCSTTAPVLNVADMNAFMNSFGSSDPVADVNGDGSLNVLDYNAFLNAYGVGCN